MGESDALLMVAAVLFGAVVMLSLAALRGWEGWLQLRQARVAEGRVHRRAPSPAAARLELAELRDRVRRLEAIADGVED
ncbi:MAG TPA: hypothetical protein VEX35_00865 [Allosphingosinicella sp.]|nr:hypothetical protein [Allosphingosinicella sp.]